MDKDADSIITCPLENVEQEENGLISDDHINPIRSTIDESSTNDNYGTASTVISETVRQHTGLSYNDSSDE